MRNGLLGGDRTLFLARPSMTMHDGRSQLQVFNFSATGTRIFQRQPESNGFLHPPFLLGRAEAGLFPGSFFT